uniref:Putative secreted protein n=1 Tax=Ixodes ricinus TaxID=34613 RepID=A0A6B0U7X4_IXORI
MAATTTTTAGTAPPRRFPGGLALLLWLLLFFSFRGTTGGRRRIEENGRTCGTLRSPTAGSDCVRACALCVRNETVPLSLSPSFFFFSVVKYLACMRAS